MNVSLIEKPPFPGASTYKTPVRLRLVGIDAVSTERLGQAIPPASPFGDERAAFSQSPWSEVEHETWTEAKNQRRCDLIDRKYAGSLTPSEIRELARLQAEMLYHRQRVAPLPLEDAHRLYEELLAGVSTSRSATDA